MLKRLHFVILAIGFALVSSLGCGDGRPSRVPISGQVLIDGEPLKFGTIRFTPANDRMSGGMLDSEGRFNLSCFEKNDGAVVGIHQVTVLAAEQISSTKVRWHAPRKYAELDSSGLQYEITNADDSLKINLTWDGAKPFDEVVEGE